MTLRFAGKAALVTGAGQGLGHAIARRLAEEGARVALVDSRVEAAEAVAEAIRAAGGEALALEADVADEAQVAAMVARTVARFGGLHQAVNNAGVAGAVAPVADMAAADWRRVIEVNLTGVFLGMKHQIPALRAAGGGAIVNVASVFATRAHPRHAAYAAAKWGVLGLTKTAALEYAGDGVRINALCPGIFDTPMARAGGASAARIEGLAPMGRMGRPEEAAAAVAFLLSEDAAYVTAAGLSADGGLFA